MALRLRKQDRENEALNPLDVVKNILLKPVLPFVSRPVRQAYLTIFLLTSTGLILLGLAVTAYTLFYYSYVPRIGFERAIHLQFDSVYSTLQTNVRDAHPYPYGITTLSSDLVSAQKYDVAVELTLPRTPSNQEAGNFMLEVTMLAPTDASSSNSAKANNILDAVRADIPPTSANAATSASLLARSRRPAILPYRSPIVDTWYKLTELPFYLFNLRAETTSLRVPVFEGISFARGWRNLPATLQLELQSSHPLQVYSAKVTFRARFAGLRWLLYNHRLISATVFVSMFWATEMMFAGAAWIAVAMYLADADGVAVKAERARESASRIKREEEDEDEQGEPVLSDTERTFPTFRGQAPLKYSGSSTPEIKREEVEAAGMVPEAVVKAMEADDEDEDVDFFDSGIGTSMESGGAQRRDSVRRRRGRLPGREEGEQQAYRTSIFDL